jgi:hypothetical protein
MMSLLRSMLAGLRSMFREAKVSQELDEELRGFLEMAAEEKMKQGMSRKDALRAVRLVRSSAPGDACRSHGGFALRVMCGWGSPNDGRECHQIPDVCPRFLRGRVAREGLFVP